MNQRNRPAGVSINYADDEWKWYGVTKRYDVRRHQDEEW